MHWGTLDTQMLNLAKKCPLNLVVNISGIRTQHYNWRCMSSIWLSPYKAWQKSTTQLALFKYSFACVKINPLRLRSLDYNANKLDRRRCILPTRLDQTQVQSESRSSNLTLLPWKQNPKTFANGGNLNVFHPARCRLSKPSRNFPGGLPVKTPKAV